MSLEDPQMEKGWKLWMLIKSDILWMERPFPLKAVGTLSDVNGRRPLTLQVSRGYFSFFRVSKGLQILEHQGPLPGNEALGRGEPKWPQLSHTP